MSDDPRLLVAALALVAVAGLTLTRRLFSGDAARRHLDLLARAEGRLAEVPAAIKLLGLLAGALTAVVCPPDRLPWMALAGAGVLVAARVPLGLFAERLADLLPFAALASAGVLLAGDLGRFAEVLARAVLVQALLAGLAVCTRLPDLLDGLRALRLPAILVTLCGLALRFLLVLLDEAARMGLGFEARAVGPRDLRLARPLGRLTGALAARGLDRADRVHQAMLARGFDGSWPRLAPPPRVTGRHVAGLLAWCAALAPALGWPA